MLIDEFIAREAPDFMPPALRGRAIVHGHCHQKSLAGMTAELGILAKASGLEVEAPDAGCCGMAGAFGYGESRFEVSRAIGERVLIPAINRSAAGYDRDRRRLRVSRADSKLLRRTPPLHLAQALDLDPQTLCAAHRE